MEKNNIRLKFSSFDNATITSDCDKIVSRIKEKIDLCIYINDGLAIDDIDKMINEIIGKLQDLGHGLYKGYKEHISYR